MQYIVAILLQHLQIFYEKLKYSKLCKRKMEITNSILFCSINTIFIRGKVMNKNEFICKDMNNYCCNISSLSISIYLD